jgi:CheY-like chemotaxis protein
LNGILAMSDVLMESQLSLEQRRSTQLISHAAEDLLQIVNELLDHETTGSRHSSVEVGAFNLRDSIDRVVAPANCLAKRKGITVRVSYDDDVPAAFVGDARHIRQILNNLIGNAVKFTAEGEVNVTIIGKARKQVWRLRIDVCDTGPGIPRKKIKSIFNAFSRLEATSTTEGTGLGLSICKTLAERMSGTIEVKSQRGKGSTFALIVDLPVANDPPKRKQRSVKKHATPSIAERPMRVLIADDSPTNRLVIASLLKKVDVELELTSDGKEALAAFSVRQPDLILMDLSMPEMDGIEATSAIRQLEAKSNLSRTPIIALTANAMRGDRDRCIAADMDDYLSKPVRSAQLRQILQTWRGARDGSLPWPNTSYRGPERRSTADMTSNQSLRKSITDGVFDPNHVAAMLDELGSRQFSSIAAQFMKEMRSALQSLSGNVSRSNSADVVGVVNLVRSAASNLGLTELVDCCDRIRGPLLAGSPAASSDIADFESTAQRAFSFLCSVSSLK